MAKCPADALTRKHLEKEGYLVDKVESYNAFTKRRKDLYHFLDFVALHPHKMGVLGIQTTTKSNLSTRVKKAKGMVIKGVNAYDLWLATGNNIEFHGWYKDTRGWWQPKVIKVNSLLG